MAFIEWLAKIVSSPVESIVEWFNDLGVALGDALDSILKNVAKNATLVVIEGVACIMITYSVYCAIRIMFTTKDEVFNEYANKTLISCVCYYAAKYGSVYLLHLIGA